MSADVGDARLEVGWVVLVLLSDVPALERSMVGAGVAAGLVSPGVESSLSLELSEGGWWSGFGSLGRAVGMVGLLDGQLVRRVLWCFRGFVRFCSAHGAACRIRVSLIVDVLEVVL